MMWIQIAKHYYRISWSEKDNLENRIEKGEDWSFEENLASKQMKCKINSGLLQSDPEINQTLGLGVSFCNQIYGSLWPLTFFFSGLKSEVIKNKRRTEKNQIRTP